MEESADDEANRDEHAAITITAEPAVDVRMRRKIWHASNDISSSSDVTKVMPTVASSSDNNNGDNNNMNEATAAACSVA